MRRMSYRDMTCSKETPRFKVVHDMAPKGELRILLTRARSGTLTNDPVLPLDEKSLS